MTNQKQSYILLYYFLRILLIFNSYIPSEKKDNQKGEIHACDLSTSTSQANCLLDETHPTMVIF
jgi:hypothetical protein